MTETSSNLSRIIVRGSALLICFLLFSMNQFIATTVHPPLELRNFSSDGWFSSPMDSRFLHNGSIRSCQLTATLNFRGIRNLTTLDLVPLTDTSYGEGWFWEFMEIRVFCQFRPAGSIYFYYVDVLELDTLLLEHNGFLHFPFITEDYIPVFPTEYEITVNLPSLTEIRWAAYATVGHRVEQVEIAVALEGWMLYDTEAHYIAQTTSMLLLSLTLASAVLFLEGLLTAYLTLWNKIKNRSASQPAAQRRSRFRLVPCRECSRRTRIPREDSATDGICSVCRRRATGSR